LLKLAIRSADREAAEEGTRDPDYSTEIARLARESLNAIPSAGQEVAAAITMLRESRDDAGEDPAADDIVGMS
jgi:hypothetical protein